LLKLENPDAQILASIEGGYIYEITVEEGSKGDGKTVREVSGSKDDLYVAVRRNKELIIPNGDVMFKPGDIVLVFTKKADEAKSVERMKSLFGNN
ncbi:MAG TPA: TrkA family potassium uptake protein, partial [Methanocorpusculum sp.]|nr:TrkA family potassium uptake protein [Methanocorpusculum sp.]